MKAVILSGLPALVVGARAAARADGSPTAADTPWELWATATALPSRLQLTGDGPEADYAMVDGHAVFTFVADPASVTVRVMLAGTPGTMFIAANAGEARMATPAGPIPGARIASLLLINRACLFDTRDWWARMREFQRLRQQVCNDDATPAEVAAFTALRREVESRTPPVHRATMRAPNEAFFGEFKHDDIRLYEHDDLHRTTCYYDEPLYLSAKDDKSLAIIPRSSFERMSHQDRGRLVREECHAIALERVVIPARALGLHCDPADAYLYALHRICTDLATGWFRDFAIDCFDELSRADTDFAGRFAHAVATGAVRARESGALWNSSLRAWPNASVSRVCPARFDRTPAGAGPQFTRCRTRHQGRSGALPRTAMVIRHCGRAASGQAASVRMKPRPNAESCSICASAKPQSTSASRPRSPRCGAARRTAAGVHDRRGAGAGCITLPTSM